MEESPPIGDVFISHALSDDHLIDSLRRVVMTENFGISQNFDEESVPGGVEASIRRAIRTCVAFIVVLTEDSHRRRWVRWEVGEALAMSHTRIVPITHRVDVRDLEEPMCRLDRYHVITLGAERSLRSRLRSLT